MSTAIPERNASSRLRYEREDFFCAAPQELDPASAPEFEKTLASVDPNTNVTVDLTSMTFCDSSGLTVLIKQHHRLLGGGGTLMVKNPPEMFLELLAVTGLDDLIVVSGPSH